MTRREIDESPGVEVRYSPGCGWYYAEPGSSLPVAEGFSSRDEAAEHAMDHDFYIITMDHRV